MRGDTAGTTVLRHGGLFFDRVGRTIELNGHALVLSERERTLLAIFLQQPGKMVSKAHIVEAMCEHGDSISTNAVEVYVHRLRKRLAAGGVKIYTVRGLGYCLDEALNC